MAKRARKRQRTDPARQIAGLLGGGAQGAPAERGPRDAARKHFTPDEHIEWVEAHCYRNAKAGGWQPLRYAEWQREVIRRLWAVTANGTLRYRTIIPCLPRRCGKSEIAGLYDLHRADAYDDQLIVIQANSEDQGEETVLKTITETLYNSPALRGRLAWYFGQRLSADGDIVVQSGLVLFNRTGSTIKVQPAKESTAYGQRIDVYHNTELCKAHNDAVYQVGASSTGDAWCGLAIVDSNMGSVSNPVYRYVKLAEQAAEESARAAEEGREPDPGVGDASIGAVWIHFDDLADVLKRGCGEGLEDGAEPIHPWLDADWVRGRYMQMIRSEFLRNHCNRPSGAGEAIWSDEQIAPLFAAGAPAMVHGERLVELARGIEADLASLAVGVGLDRAGAFSKTPDRSVLCATGRLLIPSQAGKPVEVYDERGKAIGREPSDGTVYLLLGAWEFMYALRDPIQKRLLEIDRMWGIGAACLEAYQASDLGEWCLTQRFGKRVSIRHMTAQAKHQLVQFANGLVITRRALISPYYTVLRAELTHYAEDASGAVPSYGGEREKRVLDVVNPFSGEPIKQATTWIKDDYLEAWLWSLAAARDAAAAPRARAVAKPAEW